MIGTTLGPYRIERELGSGGMGKVYAATLERPAAGLQHGDVVALKVVHPHLLETEGFFRRFLREADIGAAVRHPNVVRTFLADALSGQHFLVMEYVEGQTLGELQRELDRVPEELCRHVAREVCKGLGAIHDAGVIHRDLKPENVLITGENVVKVMDLGVARLTDEALRLSQSGMFVGSVEYAAPEQFTGGKADVRTDLHGLGLLLYEIACGQHPYRAAEFRIVLKRICENEPRRIGEINPQLSPFYEEVIHTLLAKKPEERFGSSAEVLAVFEEGEESRWWRDRSRTIRAETNRPLRRIRIPRETAVYGREKELESLGRLYAQAAAGDGQVVLVEGEAGIGKSRLVDELVARLRRDGEDFHFLFGSYPPSGAGTASGGFSNAYRQHFGEDGSAAYLGVTPILAPAFDAFLRGEPPPKGEEPISAGSLQTCFINATRALADERMTVVLIDDLHFSPQEARGLFTALSLAAPGQRLLLLGTSRPGVPEDWMADISRMEHATHLELARLGPKDLVQLLQDSFQSQRLSKQLGVPIALKSDGNPFFVFEIIRGLREGQFITQKDDGTWVTTQMIDDIQIPSSVLDLVNARVAGLTEDERNLLDMAACQGFEFDPVVVGDALGLPRIPTLRALGQIERQHRLVRSKGRRYAFDHHQVQEALYRVLNEYLREEYHAALGGALESHSKAGEIEPEAVDGALRVDLCDHFLRGAAGGRALRYLEPALEHLHDGYLNAQMVDLAERALAVPALLTGTRRATTLLSLTSALNDLGRRDRQEEAIREAEALAQAAGDDELLGRVAAALGILLIRTSRPEEAEAALRRALEIAQASGDRTAEGNVTGSLGGVFLARGRLAEAGEHFERLLEVCRETGFRQGEASATGNLGVTFLHRGRLAEAKVHIERHLALSKEIGFRRGEATATGNLGLILRNEGHLPEAREHFQRALELNREIGFREGEAAALGNLGGVLFLEGRLEEARERYDQHLALSREIANPRGEATAFCWLGIVSRAEGRLEEAQESLEQALELSRKIGDAQGEAFAQHSLGGVLREAGHDEESEARLVECLALCERIGQRRLAALTQLSLGSLRAASGNGESGREALVAARDLAIANGFPGAETLARCELALLPGGEASDALSIFAEAEGKLTLDERREARWLLWRATGDRLHIEEARRLLDESVAHVADETRASMLEHGRLNREIVAASKEQGL